MKSIIIILASLSFSILAYAQSSPADTVVVHLAKTTTLTLTMEDRNDLDLLEHYDFGALFEDILYRLSLNDTMPPEEANEFMEEEDEMEDEDEEGDTDEEDEGDDDPEDDEWDEEEDSDDEYEDDGSDYENEDWDSDRERFHFFSHLFNVDLGINNYFDNAGFPDDEQYMVRPWGSWYVAFNSLYRSRFSNHFLVEWGGGLSWYNFKFQDEETLLFRDGADVVFTRDARDVDFIKSKLTVTYLNVSAMPIFEFGRYRDYSKGWKSHRTQFRVGAGLYGGYRLGSYTKQVYEIGNDKDKDRDHDSFYLNNFRYGIRFQFGIHETDFFINYDLNDLFREDRGPELNAYSFGFIF